MDLTGALILTMTGQQADYVRKVFPEGRIHTLRGYAGLEGDIRDPYGGATEIYIQTALLIAEAVEAAADKILSEART